MKKIILACTLILSGVIGGTGWLIAHVYLVPPPHSITSLTEIFSSSNGTDGNIILFFYAVSVLGLILFLSNLGNEHDKTS